MSDGLLTPEQVAERWQVKRSWVYRAARDGVIPCVRLGHYVRFEEETLREFERKGGATVDGNRAGAAATAPPTTPKR
jgi:excisionase family DNA binding protein